MAAFRQKFLLIDTCPCNSNIAPYIAICLQDARTHAISIYRGDDARPLLNKYGHHSQYQLYHATSAERQAWGILGTPDKPGHSSHELFSDGNPFYGVPDGTRLERWQQGFDVPSSDSQRVIEAAARYGWVLARPYSSGSEVHHLNFRRQPHATPRTAARILKLRATLPRS